VNIAISYIVPYMLRSNVHGVAVLGLVPVLESMRTVVSTTAYIAANKADPKVLVCTACAAGRGRVFGTRNLPYPRNTIALGISANWTSGATPLF
jgi:hypothetical protein